jgi:hypothetical protein
VLQKLLKISVFVPGRLLTMTDKSNPRYWYIRVIFDVSFLKVILSAEFTTDFTEQVSMTLKNTNSDVEAMKSKITTHRCDRTGIDEMRLISSYSFEVFGAIFRSLKSFFLCLFSRDSIGCVCSSELNK